MEELLATLKRLLEESLQKENTQEFLYSYMTRNIKNKQMDTSDILDLKPSEVMLLLSIHIGSVKDFDFETFENNVIKLKKTIDGYPIFDLQMLLQSLYEISDDYGKFDMELIRNCISSRWHTKYNENVEVDPEDPLDVIGNVSTDFDNIEDAMLFIKTINEINDNYIIRYKDSSDPTGERKIELDYNFLEALIGYATAKSLGFEKRKIKLFLDEKLEDWMYKRAVEAKEYGEGKKVSHESSLYRDVKKIKEYIEFEKKLSEDQKEYLFLLDRYIDDIKRLYETTKKKYKEEEKINSYIIRCINYIETIINERIKDNQIKIKEEDFKYLLDPLKDIFITSVFKHNNSKFLNLIQEYENNKLLNNSELDKVLATHNIIITKQEEKQKILQMSSIEEIEKIIIILNNSYFSFIKENEELLINILKYSSFECLTSIKKLLENEIITGEFLINNPEILFIRKDKDIKPLAPTLITNINNLSKIVKIKNIKKKSSELFLLKPEELRKRIDILKTYNIDLKNTDITNFSILSNPKQIDILDSYIELGLYLIVQNNPEITRYDCQKVKRINIYKEMNPNEDINDISKIKKIMKDSFYGIQDRDLESYIDTIQINNSIIEALKKNDNNEIINQIKDLPLLTTLNKYSLDEITYNIDGIIISKNKVLRCMSTLYHYIMNNTIMEEDALFNSIIYNFSFNEEQLNKIKCVILSFGAPNLS